MRDDYAAEKQAEEARTDCRVRMPEQREEERKGEERRAEGRSRNKKNASPLCQQAGRKRAPLHVAKKDTGRELRGQWKG